MLKPRMLVALSVAVALTMFGLPFMPNGLPGSATPASAAAGVNYTYDALGRLKTVTNPAGETATYNYDAVGNLLSISRSTGVAAAAAQESTSTSSTSTAAPTVSSVEPATATSGDTVTVSGSGFADEPLDNSVRIGRKAATVVSASSSSLKVVVPPDSAGGKVHVKTAGGSAGSKESVAVPAGSGGAESTKPATRNVQKALPSAPRGATAVAGYVVKLDGSPLAGVTMSIGKARTVTDQYGQFLLKGMAPGHQKLVIDGATVPGPDRYGIYEAGVRVVAGRTTPLPWDVWMPAQDGAGSVSLPSPTTQPVVVTNPALPGVEIHVPAGTTITDRLGKPVTKLTLTPLPLDRTPIPLAPGMPIYFDLQPGGATIQGPGLKVVYPNVTNHPPGTRLAFVNYDPDSPGMGWRSYGTGTTRPEGTIVPDGNTAIYRTTSFGVTYHPHCQDISGCPDPGEDSEDGDPVNLSTGLFVMSKTDHALPDVLPVSLTRTYRQNFDMLKSFGIGQSNNFDMFVAPDPNGGYSLGLPDGGRVNFLPGADEVYRALSTPTQFAGAVLTRASAYDFNIRLRDGTVITTGGKTASLVAIADRFGNKLTVTRNSAGHMQSVTSPNGRWVAFTWGPCIGTSICITKATDNIGRSTSYSYDEFGRLTTVTDAAGKVTRYGWAPCEGNTCTQILTITDPTNTTFLTNRYDANGRVDLQTQADNTTFRFAYLLDANGRVTRTTVTDPRGILRVVNFNATGLTVKDTLASGKPEVQATTITRAAGTGFVTKVVDQLGRATAFTYDGLGNVLSTTRLSGTADAVTAKFTYEPAFNRIATATDPLNRVTRFAYDDAAQTITVTDPLGRASVATLAEGQPVMLRDALGNRTDMSYLFGDLVAVADPLGRVSTRYVDDGGRIRRVTNPSGDYTDFSYDSLNQVTSTTDALGGKTSFSYDANGNRLSVTDAKNQATTYTYDKLDRPTTRTDPMARAQTYAYDAGGNLITATDRNGIVTRHTYDGLGRGLTTTFGSTATGSESTITYTYDAGNRLTKAVDSKAGTITRAFDPFDRMTSETTPEGGVAYTYDKVNRRSTMTVAGQPQVAYAYDNGDRLTSIAQGTSVAGYSYDALDRQTSLTLPNGLVQRYAYDAASQLSSITYVSGTTIVGDLTYTYDASGRRTSVGGSYARTGLPPSLSSATYNANNEVTNFGGTAPTYDKEGQLKTDGTNTYTWNARGELASISGGTTASFSYDAFGRRTQKTVGGTTTAFLYDGPNIIQELSGATPTTNLLTGLGVDETLTRTDSTGTRQFLTDALGSTVALTDNARAITTNYTYDPFGKTATAGAADKNSLQFTGRENDGTGLQYSRARYYSPGLQRFISQDPIGFGAGDVNLSAYVGNSPTNFTDPSGLVAPLVAACAAGAVEGVVVDGAIDVLSGRKVTAKGLLKSAVLGCIGGVTGLGLAKVAGKVLGKLGGLFGKRGDDAAKACANSFVPETRILMADGTTKPIAEVVVGDMVVAADPVTGERGPRSVTNTIVGDGIKELIDIEIDQGLSLTSTDNHPFWVDNERKWVDAQDLKIGNGLLLAGGGTAQVTDVMTRSARQEVHNLTVDGLHTYYVLAGHLPVLVHNCDINDLDSLRGVKPDAVADAAKREGWQGPFPSRDGNGQVWRHPTNRGEQLIINNGYPGASDPLHGGPYVKVSRGGQVVRIPLEGNPGL